ncbi:MAG TPA: FixH family protein [Burkholderiales bacterium]|nr:FixH family protein [Burkholderiales bacterium]
MTKNVPWYRHHWPWLLMLFPALAVLGGVAMLIVAMGSNDGLVADDYYKRGLAINQTLSRDHAAASGHYRARVMFNPTLDRVRVAVSGDRLPDALTLRLTHPTRAGQDRVAVLTRGAAGLYEAPIEPVGSGRWGVSLEDGAGAWRLSGTWRASDEPVVDLVPNG